MLKKVFRHRVNKLYIGRHVIADFWGCTYKDDPKHLLRMITKAAEISGATVVDSSSHKFEPNGTTCILLLAESHLSIHTWPEFDYVAIDMFTCGPKMNPRLALEYLQKELKPNKKQIKTINRGKN